jgi:hypothetical protein
MKRKKKPLLVSTASFSEDRRYRYTLFRRWEKGPVVAFIGLNPSTADETADDPTIRRCTDFSERWLCGGMVMLNIFAFRATDPEEMMLAGDPVGPYNDVNILAALSSCKMAICCWGNHGTHLHRASQMKKLLSDLFIPIKQLGPLTNEGQPRHPLYLHRETQPEPFVITRHEHLIPEPEQRPVHLDDPDDETVHLPSLESRLRFGLAANSHYEIDPDTGE